jgi:hypothetical protein
MNTINHGSEHIVKLKGTITRYLEEVSSITNPITFQNLWETLNRNFKKYFEENGITQEVFAKVCIFSEGKSIKKIGNGDPTIMPKRTFYYV